MFTTKLYAGRHAAPISFDNSGVVVLGCNIHDQMLAWAVIVDTPFFGKSAADGAAALNGLPPGEYRLNTWYPGLTQPVVETVQLRRPRAEAGAHRHLALPPPQAAAVIRIQRLQTRIVVLLRRAAGTGAGRGVLVRQSANSGNARAKVEEELDVGQRVFARLLEQNADKLELTARVLAADFAFREAIATHDGGTIASVLTNHGARIGADAMLFVDLDGTVVSDTLRPQARAHSIRIPGIAAANRPGADASMEVLDGRAFQLVSCRCWHRCPSDGWSWASRWTMQLARDLRQLTELEVSFALHDHERWRVLASTLKPDEALRCFPPCRRARTRHAHRCMKVPASTPGAGHSATTTTTRASWRYCIARSTARWRHSSGCAIRYSCWPC